MSTTTAATGSAQVATTILLSTDFDDEIAICGSFNHPGLFHDTSFCGHDERSDSNLSFQQTPRCFTLSILQRSKRPHDIEAFLCWSLHESLVFFV